MAATVMSIEITPSTGPYKSIGNLVWHDIPGFAVLTGRNGSGKTQLLELLAYSLSEALPTGLNQLPVSLKVSGHTYAAHEIGFLPTVGRFSGGSGSSISNLPNVRQQVMSFAENPYVYRHDIVNYTRARRSQHRLSGHNFRALSPEELAELLPDDHEFAIDDLDVTEGLAHVFMGYRLKALQAIEANRPGLDKKGQPLATPPWEVVNDALRTAGFPYEVVSPHETDLIDTYILRVRDLETGVVINAIDLSSGEKVILQVVLWLFTAGKDGLMPKLLLLDEPDAHLHPSMTTQFLDTLVEVLVKRHGIRVIMTTHSPSTVALAPDGSVFRLERGANSVQPASRTEMISVLTAGLVTVARTSKFCFVEDEDDVAFYEVVYGILTDYGPSKDPMALNPSVPVAFIPASVGKGVNKQSGGKTVVEKWVNKLDAEPLISTFFGIIDRDSANSGGPRIFVLGRYSFENYLLDPVNLFALMLENDSAPVVPGLTITPGDEHRLRSLDAQELQQVVDTVCGLMEASTTLLSRSATQLVQFSNGVQVAVPNWVIDYRGHDLLPIAQAAFGGPQLINPPRLRKAMQRTRMIPGDLASVLAKIQSA
nr:ATP-binding protein [uncultured Brevundimonas sp.]